MVEIEQPTWVYHGEFKSKTAILSVDTHVDGTRFVTGGGDSSIRIWKMSTLVDGKDDSLIPSSQVGEERSLDASEEQLEKERGRCREEQKSQLLASLQRHDRCVNCVRFSPDGKYLAAGSDDATVSLHQFYGKTTGSIGGFSNKEDWRCIKLFRDHSQDVLGVAWSPDSTKLASCSVDNKVIIWDVLSQTKKTELLGHETIVKGVAWDPIGRFLVSQTSSEVIVWETSGWKLCKRITGPFKEGSSDSLFLRPDWAPDGSSFLAVNSLHGSRYTSVMFNREEFKDKYEVSGHKGSIVSCRFNSRIFYRKDNNSENNTFYALGGMDNTLTIWSTAMEKPFGKALHLFNAGVIDIAWTGDGMNMICCSHQGRIAFFKFTERELGKPIPQDQVEQYLHKIYGASAWNDTNIIEEPSSLVLAKQQPSSREMMKEPQDMPENQEETVAILQPRSKRKKSRTRPALTVQPQAPSRQTPTSSSIFSRQSSQTEGNLDTEPTPMDVDGVASLSVESLELPSPTLEQRTEPTKELKGTAASIPMYSHQMPKRKEPPTQSSGISKRRRIYGEESQLFLLKDLSIEFLEDTKELRVNSRDGKLLWNTFLESASKFEHNATYLFATSAQQLHVFSINGRKVLPPLALGSSAKFLKCNSRSHVLVLTQDYQLWVWDILKQSMIAKCSIDHLLEDAEHQPLQVDDVALTSQGVAILALSNGSSFMYHSGMQAWMCIADRRTALSPFLAASSAAYEWGTEPHIVSELRARAGQGSNPLELTRPQASLRTMQTTEDLEVALAAAELLHSVSEYKRFAALYVRHLTSCGEFIRLRDYFDHLLGPSISRGFWQAKIGKESKHNLLRELLSVANEQRSAQRITAEYKQKLDTSHRL